MRVALNLIPKVDAKASSGYTRQTILDRLAVLEAMDETAEVIEERAYLRKLLEGKRERP